VDEWKRQFRRVLDLVGEHGFVVDQFELVVVQFRVENGLESVELEEWHRAELRPGVLVTPLELRITNHDRRRFRVDQIGEIELLAVGYRFVPVRFRCHCRSHPLENLTGSFDMVLRLVSGVINLARDFIVR
jgi:hypothetical protein